MAGLFAAHQQPALRDAGIIGTLPTAMIAIAAFFKVVVA
jgi:hypothetical protein